MGRIDPKRKAPTVRKQVSEQLLEKVFLPWTAIVILLHLVAMYLGSAHMWGVHFYHFFPAPIGWALVLASLALLIPSVRHFLYTRLEEFAQVIKRPFSQLGENKTFLILSILSLPIFWIFRTRLHLLGDGYFRIQDLPEGRLHLQEWLDGFIHLLAFRVMRNLVSSWTPELTYSVISILCGGIFVFVALKLCSFLGKTGLGKVLIFFFLISLGSVQLFFGYVESYSILQVALLAYIWFAALYLSRKSNILPALFCFVLSVGLHITSLVFLPSFIYLITRGRRVGSKEEISWAKTISNPVILGGFIIAAVAVVSWTVLVATGLERTGKGIIILPLTGSESYSFGMFSPGHISEFVNQLLLLSPVGVSLMIFFIFFKMKFKDFQDRLVNFLIVAAFSGLIYLFVFNFTLGSADWDLRSSPAPFFGLLGVLFFLRSGEAWSEGKKWSSGKSAATRSSGGRRFKTWCLIFIWVGLFHTVPWVLVNAHHHRSLNRYLLIQENDPHPIDEVGYKPYKIARLLSLAGLTGEMKHVYQRAIERNPFDTLSYYNLANWYEREGDLDQAMLILDTLIKIDPVYPLANWLMGSIYIEKEDYTKALTYLEKGLPSLEDNADFLHHLWVANYSANRPEKAVACARQMIKLRPNHLEAYHLLGLGYAQMGAYEEARDAWERILGVNPKDSAAIQNLEKLEEYLKK